jgi:cytochrome c oxidase accessory protein FixG
MTSAEAHGAARARRPRGFGPWRRAAGLAQAAVFLGLPFLRVNGESALRLDVPAGRLHVFGLSLAVDEAFVVLLAVLAASFAFLLATVVLGRAWCGWSCPQTVLSDLTAWALRRGQGRLRRSLGLLSVAALSTILAAATLWYFVPPQEFLARLAGGRLGAVLSWSWGAVGAVLFADLALVRQVFCATVCPYARLQGVLLDDASLVVAYDRGRAAECVDCGACVRVCPTGIDIRDGLQTQCIACAACIDACQPVMRRLGRAPELVGYFLGDPGHGRRSPASSCVRTLLRPSIVALAGATAVSLALLGATVARRSPLELVARDDAAFTPRRAADGTALHAFAVDVENRTRGPVSVSFVLEGGGAAGGIAIRPEQLALGPGERRHVRLLARISSRAGLPPGRVLVRLVGEAREGERLLGREDAAVSLVIPEDR